MGDQHLKEAFPMLFSIFSSKNVGVVDMWAIEVDGNHWYLLFRRQFQD